MKIRIEDSWERNTGAPAEYRFSAVDDDTYDGAPDSSNRNHVGRGPTHAAAREDLLGIMADWEDEQWEQLRQETEESDQRAFERAHAWGRS